MDGKKYDDLDRLQDQIKENAGRAIGIGEGGGLIITTAKRQLRERQAAVFIKVIELAESLSLPLIIHSRDAEQQALKMVKNLERLSFTATAVPLAR